VTDPKSQPDHLFETWYAESMPRLFNFIAYRVHDQALAEDITATVCEKAVKNLHLYDEDRGAFNAWMFGIARHEVQHALRNQRRRPPALSLDSLPEVQADGASVEHIAERRALFHLAQHHLSHLPDREQELIALRFGAGLSHGEISRFLGMNPVTARVVLHRALSKLRSALQAVEEVDHVES
jgi:RNA polymerase sigma-70 factor (ECF subfamily)